MPAPPLGSEPAMESTLAIMPPLLARLIQPRQHLGREQPEALFRFGVRQEAGAADEDQVAEAAESPHSNP